MNRKWTEKNWQERREKRFEKWLNPPGVTFVNREAGENYRAKATRIIKAIKLEEPDRIPCQIPPGSFPAYNVTGSLVCMGTPEDVKKYCQWLIDTCAPGGGYILSMGVSIDRANPDNFKAMIQTAKEYGVYGRN